MPKKRYKHTRKTNQILKEKNLGEKNPMFGKKGWMTKKYWTSERKKIISGKNNPNWKGDNVGYDTLHEWVKKHKLKPKVWERWLEGNWDDWLKGKICLNVELSKDINLFIIESKEQFLNEFKKLTGIDYLKLDLMEKFMLQKFHKKLKEKYDGIWLKATPFYEHRLDLSFSYFYSWDCESICVWNKNKIKFMEIKK